MLRSLVGGSASATASASSGGVGGVSAIASASLEALPLAASVAASPAMALLKQHVEVVSIVSSSSVSESEESVVELETKSAPKIDMTPKVRLAGVTASSASSAAALASAIGGGKVKILVEKVEGQAFAGGSRDPVVIGVSLDSDGGPSSELKSRERRRDRISGWMNVSASIPINEEFELNTTSKTSYIVIRCYKAGGLLGEARIVLGRLPAGEVVKKWYTLLSKGSKESVFGQVLLNVQFERKSPTEELDRVETMDKKDTEADRRYLEFDSKPGLKIFPDSVAENSYRQSFHNSCTDTSMSSCLLDLFVVLRCREKSSGVIPGPVRVEVDKGVCLSIEASVPSEVVRFCFPKGSFSSSVPLPEKTFCFVLSDSVGLYYSVATVFYDFDESRNLYFPNAFCFLSRYRCFQVMETLSKKFVKGSVVDGSIDSSKLSSFIDNLKIELSKSPFHRTGRARLQITSDPSDVVSYRRNSTMFSFPDMGFSLAKIFQVLDVNVIIKACLSLMTERNVLVCCSEISLLTPICEALHSLLYPLRRHESFVYVPVLPDSLKDYLLSPVPFLIGMTTSSAEFGAEYSSIRENVVILDVDAGTIEFDFPLPALPRSLVRDLSKKIRGVLHPELLGVETKILSPADVEIQIRKHFLNFVRSILQGYRKYLYFAADGTPIFIEEEFLDANPDLRTFLSKFMHTEMFRSFVEDHRSAPALLFDISRYADAPYSETLADKSAEFKDEYPEDESLELSDSASGDLRRGSKRKISLPLVELFNREMDKPDGTHIATVVKGLLSSGGQDFEVLVSAGQLLVLEEWRIKFSQTCEEALAVHPRLNLSLESFRGLIFLTKITLQHCFDESDFDVAKRVLDFSRSIWCRSPVLESHYCLIDLIKSSTIWRHPQFWVYGLSKDIQRQIMRGASGVRAEKSIRDVMSVMSAIVCVFRELSIPRTKASEILNILAINEELDSESLADLQRLLDSLYGTRVARTFN